MPAESDWADSIVLPVEDSDTDAYLFRLALQEAGIPAVVYRVSDGEQALLLLHKLGSFQQAPTPRVVFLDINMPRMNGGRYWQPCSRMSNFGGFRWWF